MPVELTLPAFLAEKLHRTTLPLALPSYVLFLYFPFFAKLRALIRFGVFVLVFSSAAAGLGSAWLLKKIQFKWQPWAVAGLLALVFLDFYPGTLKQVALVEPRPVDAWLAAQPGKGALIQFPFVQEEDQDQTYYTLFNGKPFVGGFFNAFPPAQYARIKPLMTNFPDQQSMDLMRELKVEFVLVDVRQYTDFDKLKADCLNLGLRYATQQGNELVFEMPQ
jgi:hypothetical protein